MRAKYIRCDKVIRKEDQMELTWINEFLLVAGGMNIGFMFSNRISRKQVMLHAAVGLLAILAGLT